MSAGKRNQRRSEPPLMQDDCQHTPPTSEVFQSVCSSPVHHCMQSDLDGSVPFMLRGSDPCSKLMTSAEKDVVYPLAPEVARSVCVMPASMSWDGPSASYGDDDSSTGGETSFSSLDPRSSDVVHDYLGSELPRQCLGASTYFEGGLEYEGDKLDEMYVTFGSCSITEPIYANEVCVLEQDKPVFVQPKWVCQEQKF